MLHIGDVAKRLGCTESGVRKLVARGEIRHFQHRKRGRLKFKPEWVDEFIARYTSDPKGEQPPPRRVGRPSRKQSVPVDTGNVCGFGWELLKKRV
jgi:excisionase family DNA binding protein